MIIQLLISVLVVLLLYWAVTSILAAFNVGEPAYTVGRVMLVLVLVVMLLQAFGLVPRWL